MNDKPAATVPDFNFDPIEDPQKPDRQAEVARTRDAFEKSGYVPPEVKKEAAQSPEGEAKPKKPRAKQKPKKQETSETPEWRRPRGRPAGARQHRISMKTTEEHLAFMYAIADGRELVGAFEHALEALAREAVAENAYEGRPLPAEALKLAKSLADKAGQG